MRDSMRPLWAAVLTGGLLLTAGCGDPATDSPAPNAGGTALPDTGAADEAEASTDMSRYERPGFQVYVREGRLWVFREGSEAIAEFERVGEPGKFVTNIGDGPGGITMRSEDVATIEAYLAAQ